MLHTPTPNVNYVLAVKKQGALLRIIDRLKTLVDTHIITQQTLIITEGADPTQTLQHQLESWGEGEIEAVTAFRDAFIIRLQQVLQNNAVKGDFLSLYLAYLQILSALPPEQAREKELSFINPLRDFLYAILMRQPANSEHWYQYRELGDFMADEITEIWPRNEHKNGIPIDPIELSAVNDAHKINTAIGVQYNNTSMTAWRDFRPNRNHFNDIKVQRPYAKYDKDKINDAHIDAAENNYLPFLSLLLGEGLGIFLGEKLLFVILPLIITSPVPAYAVPLYLLGCFGFIAGFCALGCYVGFKAGEWLARYRAKQRFKTLEALMTEAPAVIPAIPQLAQIQRGLLEEKRIEPAPSARPSAPAAPMTASATPTPVTWFSMFIRVSPAHLTREEKHTLYQNPKFI